MRRKDSTLMRRRKSKSYSNKYVSPILKFFIERGYHFLLVTEKVPRWIPSMDCFSARFKSFFIRIVSNALISKVEQCFLLVDNAFS